MHRTIFVFFPVSQDKEVDVITDKCCSLTLPDEEHSLNISSCEQICDTSCVESVDGVNGRKPKSGLFNKFNFIMRRFLQSKS